MAYQIMSFKEVETINFEDDNYIDQIMELDSINGTIEKATIKNSDNKQDIPNQVAVYNTKTNRHYGIVSSQYSLIQNDIVLGLFNTVVKELKLKPHSLSLVEGGKQFILTARVPGKLSIDKNEKGEDIIKEIIIRNGHDGKTGLSVNMNIVRLVCTNGMIGLIPSAENSFRVLHNTAAKRKFDEVISKIDIFENAFLKYTENVRFLAQKNVDKNLVESFLNECVSKKYSDQRDAVLDLFESGKGNKGKNAYDLINGYYEFLDNENKHNSFNDLFGPVGKKKEKAFNWLNMELNV